MDTTQHQLQMAAVLATGGITIAAAMAARRSVAVRRYVPAQFSGNHIPPKFNYVQDAMRAMADATLLAGGAFAFAVSSTCWIMDVNSLEGFGKRMAQMLGADKKLEFAKQQAEEAAKTGKSSDDEVADALTRWISGSKK